MGRERKDSVGTDQNITFELTDRDGLELDLDNDRDLLLGPGDERYVSFHEICQDGS